MLSSIDERERESVEECDVVTVRFTGGPSAGSENGVITNSIKPFILLGKINLLFGFLRLQKTSQFRLHLCACS